MNIRFSRWAMSVLVAAATVLISDRSWAVYHELGPSKDEWGLKYDVDLALAAGDKLTVVFTLDDEGRLKPFYSTEVVAFSAPDNQGGRSYLVKAPIKFKTTNDGRRAGEVQIPKQVADRAMIRILTLTVDGRRQTGGARYYDIPLRKYLNEAPSIAAPPTSKVAQ